MRFRFFEPDDEQETRRLIELERSGDELWTDVANSQPTPAELARQRRRLWSLEPGLSMDFVENEGYILRPLNDAALVPFAEWLVGRAPAGVRASCVRAAVPAAEAAAIVGEAQGMDLSRARLRVKLARGHLFEVFVEAPAPDSTHERLLDAANQLVMLLLGDELFEHWVGAVDAAPRPRNNPLRLIQADHRAADSWLPIGELRRALEAGRDTVKANLAELPYHRFCERADWSMLELSQEHAVGEMAPDDCLLATTMLPEMFKCFLERNHFSSRRFSKHGEVFVCAQYPSAGSLEESLGRRIELEEELNRALVPAAVGCVVANGMALGQVYIGLALADLESGLTIVRSTLQRAGVPKHSRIVFCDEIWEREWLPIWEGQRAS